MIEVQRLMSARRLVSISMLSALAGCGPSFFSGSGDLGAVVQAGAAGQAGAADGATAGTGGLAGVASGGAAGSGVVERGVPSVGLAERDITEGRAAGSGVVERGVPGVGLAESGLPGSTDSLGTAGSGGSGGQLGYDAVIGCPAVRWPDRASLTIIEGDPDDFAPSVISGNGLVVGGQLRRASARWTPSGGFALMDTLKYQVAAISCDGSVAVTTDSGAGTYRHELGQPAQQVLPGGFYNEVGPVSMTPDGQVIVGNLTSASGDGPHPTRWTSYTGDLPIAGLDNTLVYQVGLSGASFIGLDPLRIFSFNWAETKVTLQENVPPSAQHYPFILVSPDLSSYTYNWDYYQTQIEIRSQGYFNCPAVRCNPIAISGTGKVVAVVGDTGPQVGAPYRTFLWTRAHGYQDFTTLMGAYGVSAPGTLYVEDMSDDGQAFTGFMDTPTGAPYPKFYAVLPPAAYN